jgi:tellurite resistance protein
MTTQDSDKPSDETRAQLTALAQEFRGSLMLEALAAACAITSYADGQSSLIERWRFSKVLADDPLLAAMPEAALAEEWAMHRQAFITDPKAAREAALLLVARLAPEPDKARLVLDACARVLHADREVRPIEVQTLRDIAAALKL